MVDNDGKIPQGSQTSSEVILDTGVFKQMVLAAAGAVPVKLPVKLANWWTNSGEGRLKVLAEGIKGVIHRPPTLRNKWPMWQRFYSTFFDCVLPDLGNTLWDNNELADGYVVVGRHIVITEKIFVLLNKFPEIFHHTGAMMNGGFQSIRTLGIDRNIPWYLTRIEPLKGSPFELGQDESGISFQELLVQQLFAYWSGMLLVEDWLHANGSRTPEEKVPSIMWKDGKMLVSSFRREAMRRNLWSTRFVKLE